MLQWARISPTIMFQTLPTHSHGYLRATQYLRAPYPLILMLFPVGHALGSLTATLHDRPCGGYEDMLARSPRMLDVGAIGRDRRGSPSRHDQVGVAASRQHPTA